MKIRLERTGGFAGMTRTTEIDTAALSEDDRALVDRLVREADFYALPAQMLLADAASADQFHFRITIATAERTHTVEATGSAAPASLEPLLEWLNRNATGRNAPREQR